MTNREIKKVVEMAQEGDQKSLEMLLKLFSPLIVKHSCIEGEFNEDCFQELSIRLINCIGKFQVPKFL